MTKGSNKTTIKIKPVKARSITSLNITLLSSFVFSIAHEPIAMALAFGGGCLYGWLRVKTGSIYPSMIAHAIWNGFITLVVIFA